MTQPKETNIVPTPGQNVNTIEEVIHQLREGAVTYGEAFAKITSVASNAWAQVPARLVLPEEMANNEDDPKLVAYMKENGVTLEVGQLSHKRTFTGTLGALYAMITECGFINRSDYATDDEFNAELYDFTSCIVETYEEVTH